MYNFLLLIVLFYFVMLYVITVQVKMHIHFNSKKNMVLCMLIFTETTTG